MTQLQAILNYQETDKKLYALEKELSSSESRKKSVTAKKFIMAAAEKLDLFDAKAKQLKNAAAELNKKYLSAEETLAEFGNVDELVEGGADIAFYKKNALALADSLRKIKADLAAIVAEINETHEEYQKLKKQVLAAQKQYKESSEEYEKVKADKADEKNAIEEELKTLAKDIPAETLEKYLKKRKEKMIPGKIVGKFDGDRCPICKMELPLAAINTLKGGATIECDMCHGIIFGE